MSLCRNYTLKPHVTSPLLLLQVMSMDSYKYLKWQRMGKPADNNRVRAQIEQWLNYIIIKDVEEYYSNSFVAHVEGRIPLRITVDHGFVFYWLFLFFASCTHYWHIKLFNSYWFSAILLHTLGSTLRMLMASGIDKVQHAKKALIPLLFVKCIKRLPFLLGKRSAHVLPFNCPEM